MRFLSLLRAGIKNLLLTTLLSFSFWFFEYLLVVKVVHGRTQRKAKPLGWRLLLLKKHPFIHCTRAEDEVSVKSALSAACSSLCPSVCSHFFSEMAPYFFSAGFHECKILRELIADGAQ